MTLKDDATDRINTLMLEYDVCKKAGNNKARMIRIWEEVYVLLSSDDNACGRKAKSKIREMLRKSQNISHMYDENDIITYCLMDCLMKYDAEKCSAFFPWFLTFLNWWINDNIYKKNTRIATNAHGEKIRESRIQSLGQNEDGTEKDVDSLDTESIISPDEQTEGKYNAEARIAQMFSYIHFMEHSSGKAANPTRLFYSRCFVSDYMTSVCKEGLHDEITINQQEAFSSMNTEFLDFYMTKPCRNFSDIMMTALKTYRQLEISAKQEELKLPLESVVYKKYLPTALGHSVTDAAISQQKKTFNEKLGIDPKQKKWNLD